MRTLYPASMQCSSSRRPSTTKSPCSRRALDFSCSKSKFLNLGFLADVITSAFKTFLEETGNRSIYYQYDALETSIYFEGITKSVVACFETENPDSILYGTKVFDLNRAEVMELMCENGFSELEEEEEDGEHRISFEDALIDFFFEDDTMTAVSWGVLVDDQGNII